MRRSLGFAATAALGLASNPLAAQTARTGIDLSVAQALPDRVPIAAAPPPTAPRPAPRTSLDEYFAHWADHVRAARASQPNWSSPLVTTTALLQQRIRFDAAFQHAGNGADSVNLDGGKGLDLIISDTQEIQVTAAPYVIRTQPGKHRIAGVNDWPFFRFKQRLASSPASEGNYILSAWVQFQQPTGISPLTNDALTVLPTLGFGKGWGRFDIQGTIGAVIPTAHESRLGTPIVANIAFQYHVLDFLWPQIEINWTYYPDGRRGGLSQVFLTPGLVVGRIPLNDTLKLTVGVGYQTAITPHYRPSPLTPSYDHAWILSTRLSF